MWQKMQSKRTAKEATNLLEKTLTPSLMEEGSVVSVKDG